MWPATAVAGQHTTTAVGLGASALRPSLAPQCPSRCPATPVAGVADAFHYFEVHPLQMGAPRFCERHDHAERERPRDRCRQGCVGAGRDERGGRAIGLSGGGDAGAGSGGAGGGGAAGVADTRRGRGTRWRWARWGWVCQKASHRPERCSARSVATRCAPTPLQRMPAPLVRAWTTTLHLLSTAPEPMGKRRAIKAG